MMHTRMTRLLYVLILSCTQSFAQISADSLLHELETAESKAKIYNLLAEARVEDSLELSEQYSLRALEFAGRENNIREEGIAWFNLAEVNAYSFRYDSAIVFYHKALELLKEAGDDYYVSYTLNNLGWISNMYGRYDTAVSYYFESIKYIDREKHADDLAHVYINLGNANHHLGKYHTAIKYFRKSIRIIATLQDRSALPYAYNGIGLAYKFLGNFDSAIYYYEAMLEIDKKSGSLRDQAVDYGNIGALYAEWEHYAQSFEFHKQALELYLTDGSRSDLSIAYNNIGQVYKSVGRYDSALHYLNKALEIDRETGMEHYMAARYNNMGDVYFRLDQYEKALDHFSNASVINRKSGDRHSLALSLANMAKVYHKQNSNGRAERLFTESLEIAMEIGSLKLQKKIHDAMAGFFGKTGRYKKALGHREMADALNDSLYREKTSQTLADMQTRYELDRKEQQIDALNQEKELQTLLVKTYRARNYYLIGGILLALAMLSVLFFQLRSKQRAYKKLVEKNREIAEERKVILRNGDDNGRAAGDGNQIPSDNSSNHKELHKRIMKYMREEKPYLYPEVTVKEIADRLGTNSHYISEVINQQIGKNFTLFINEFRVREACELLADPANNHLTIESLARQAGFNSKSAFNYAFKAITGLTPSYYRRNARPIESQ